MALYDQFMLFGDSLFQHSSSQDRGFGLAPALQAEYIRRLDVINRGFSGYNSEQAIKVLPRIIPAPEQVIFLGANDACLEGVTGGQHVPLDRFKQNLLDIVNHPAVKRQSPRIILVTPPPMNEYMTEENDRMKGILERRRTADHTKLYADAVKDVAKKVDVALLDLWSILMKHAGWQEGELPLPGSKQIAPNPFLRMLLHDGLHFTHVAYTLYFQELMRVIGRVWPDQLPERLPYVLPEWSDPVAWRENGVHNTS